MFYQFSFLYSLKTKQNHKFHTNALKYFISNKAKYHSCCKLVYIILVSVCQMVFNNFCRDSSSVHYIQGVKAGQQHYENNVSYSKEAHSQVKPHAVITVVISKMQKLTVSWMGAKVLQTWRLANCLEVGTCFKELSVSNIIFLFWDYQACTMKGLS